MRVPHVSARQFSLLQLVVFVSIFLSGCALGPFAAKDPEHALPMPTAMNEFVIAPEDDVIGEAQIVLAHAEDTLSDIARRFNVGYEEIVTANPGVDPWLPGAGTEILIPSQWVLPKTKREGVVVNLAAMRLFYFPKAEKGQPQTVITHPVGIGRVGWRTPEGRTRISAKVEGPTWVPTVSIHKEYAARGTPLPRSVPPGPDNPMGTHVLRLGWPEYAIHGTDKPPSIGLRGTHGCLRMYPEDIVLMYQQVPVGTPVMVVNEPILLGTGADALVLQTYPVLEDDKRNHPARLKSQLQQARKAHPDRIINQDAVDELIRQPRALAMPVSVEGLTLDQQLAATPRVKNRLPLNASWDGEGDLTVAQATAQTVAANEE